MVRKLALSAVSLLAALVTVELICRIVGLRVHDLMHEKHKAVDVQVLDERGDYFRYPPGSTASLWDSTWTFNSLGMRDVEPPPRSGKFRVLVLGDSVTAGEAVAQRDIFPYRLRRFLGADGIDVMAAGVSGWNTLEEEHFLRANVERLAPNLVVLLYVANDNEPVDSIRRVVAHRLTAKDRAIQALVMHSRVFEWAVFTWRKVVGPDAMQIRGLRVWMDNVKAAGEPFAPTDPGWIASRDALVRMRDLLAGREAKLVIFFYDLGPSETEAKALAALSAFGGENGVRVFDTREFFTGHTWQSVVNDPFVDPHPNAHGHAMLAEFIARTLRNEDLVPSPDERGAGSEASARDVERATSATDRRAERPAANR